MQYLISRSLDSVLIEKYLLINFQGCTLVHINYQNLEQYPDQEEQGGGWVTYVGMMR